MIWPRFCVIGLNYAKDEEEHRNANGKLSPGLGLMSDLAHYQCLYAPICEGGISPTEGLGQCEE